MIKKIASKAQEIANERNVNVTFFVSGNIIEGCRNRKTSEEYEFDVESGFAIYDNTRNEIASSIIIEAIDSLKEDGEAIEFNESSVERSQSLNINPENEYYLRFTNDAEGDIRRGHSFLKCGSMNEAVELEGLCGFSMDLLGLSNQEIEKRVSMYAVNLPYYSEGRKAVIFEGKYINRNPNDEGVIFEPHRIEGYVKF